MPPECKVGSWVLTRLVILGWMESTGGQGTHKEHVCGKNACHSQAHQRQDTSPPPPHSHPWGLGGPLNINHTRVYTHTLTHAHTHHALALAHTSEEPEERDWGAGLKAGRGWDRKAR